MVKIFCDRCKKEMKRPTSETESNLVDMVDGCAIIRVEGENWCFLDLCDSCKEDFRLFLRNGRTEEIA